MKDGQKLKIGDAHVTPRNIQEVQASKLGDAQDTIFLLFHMLCVVLGASLFFILVFFCFVCFNKWFGFQHISFGEDTLCFHGLEHSSFHSYCSVSVLFC
jgi:hypothetical protein